MATEQVRDTANCDAPDRCPLCSGPEPALGMCRCGSPLSEHIGGLPCVFGHVRVAKRLSDLPIFGWAWKGDAANIER